MENPLSNEPEVMPVAPVEPKPQEPQSMRPTIRTLHSDVAASVHDNNISITKIALAQQARNESLPFVAEEKAHFWSAWSIGTILLVLAGLVIIVGALFVMLSKNVSLPFVNQEPPAPTLVPVTGRVSVDTTRMPRAELTRTIEKFIDDDYSSPVALEALIVQEMVTATSSEGESVMSLTPIDLERFLERLGSRAPGRLVRSTGPNMTLGRAGGSPFLITTTSSYETTFAGMLEWEPLMADDLPFLVKKIEPAPQPIVPVEPVDMSTSTTSTTISNNTATTSTASTSVASTTTATSTASTTPVVLIPLPTPAPTWKDVIVKNKDVRALVTRDGDIVLLYAFPKDGLMVIAQTKEAFTLIVDALNAPVFGM
ncbi:MAG: hypothetical protein QG633_535 [Patescibacteria group bacterium]|jgi:hypothetical protein|nr:hypothetical protein [Patescibacteria group bacterium]